MPTLMFGPFRLETHTLELTRDGQPVPIRPQPCRLLVLLASRAGQLLTRTELRDALWPGVHVRFDLGLNSCLKQIRAALGDDADRPSWIETLPRRGYRFIGAVRTAESHARPAIRRLVVLPAAATADDDSVDALVSAINDEIEVRLSRLSTSLMVAPAASLPPALTSSPSLRALADAGVDLALQCRLHAAGGLVRLTMQLMDTGERTIVWANIVEGSLDDRFAILRAAAREISGGVRSALGLETGPHRLAV